MADSSIVMIRVMGRDGRDEAGPEGVDIGKRLRRRSGGRTDGVSERSSRGDRESDVDLWYGRG